MPTKKVSPKKIASAKKPRVISKKGGDKKLASKKWTGKELISDLLWQAPNAGEILWKHGLFCAGCPFHTQETIAQGAAAHGIKVKDILEDLNTSPKPKKTRK